jgi:hypothetical protein
VVATDSRISGGDEADRERGEPTMAKKTQTATQNRKAENPKPEPKAELRTEPATTEPRTELEIANPEKTKGSVQYRIPGVAGSLRVARSLFAGTPPVRLVVVGPFAAPDPAKAARQRESAEQKAAKLEARIARANATAAKNAERLAKLRTQLEVK